MKKNYFEIRDQLPKGELWISSEILDAFGYEKHQSSYIKTALEVGAQCCFFSSTNPFSHLPEDSMTLQSLVEESHQKNLACGITIDGPFERMCKELGFMEALTLMHESKEECTQKLSQEAQKTLTELDASLAANADLLLLCDDIAYTTGLYFSPRYFDDLLAPIYSEIAAKVNGSVPLGFHSDGDLTSVLASLVNLGYKLFSLEPEAMDLPELKKGVLTDSIVIGGIKAEWLASPISNPQEIQDYVSKLAKNTGLILSSTCGLYTTESISLLRELYRIVEDIKV